MSRLAVFALVNLAAQSRYVAVVVGCRLLSLPRGVAPARAAVLAVSLGALAPAVALWGAEGNLTSSALGFAVSAGAAAPPRGIVRMATARR